MSGTKHLIRVVGSILTLLISALLLASPNAEATVYSIGDSLSDSGALGFSYTNPITLLPFEDGKVWIQYLTQSIPAFCNDSSQCKFNSNTFYYTKPGNNFSVGGAGVTFDSTDGHLPKNYTSLHYQVEALTNSHKLSRDDIVTVWIGANDIFSASSNPDTDLSVVNKAVEIFNYEITKLAKTGVKIYVITIPDLGQTPFGINSLDHGELLTKLTKIFNNGISAIADIGSVKLIDSNKLFDQLQGASDFNGSMIYCSTIIDPKHICGSTKNPEVIDTGLPFIFADPYHPSNAAHKWMGGKMLNLIR